MVIEDVTDDRGASSDVAKVFSVKLVDETGRIVSDYINFDNGKARLTFLAPDSSEVGTPVSVTCTSVTPNEFLGVYETDNNGRVTFTTSHFSDFKLAIAVDIAFDANGGTGTMDPVKWGQGDEYELPRCGFTAPAGKQFKCWEVDGKEYAPRQKITVDGDLIIKAIWQDVMPDDPGTPEDPSTPDDPAKPSDPGASNDSGSTGGSSSSGSSTGSASNTAKTGDVTDMAPWMLLLVLSGAVVIGLFINRKKIVPAESPRGKHTR